MKTKIQSLFIGLALLSGIHQALGQAIVINSLSQNGVLVCSGLQTGTVATVQWASSLAGPWQTNWAGLTGMAVGTNGVLMVSVPMFYRVLGVAAPNPNATQPPAGMALIPAGTFTMGDTLDGEGDAPPTNIYVSSFYMDVNLVSYSQWQAVYNYATNNGFNFANAGSGKAADHPVQTVDWYDCVKWSNARSQQAGLAPVYYTDAGLTQVYRNGDEGTVVYPNWGANGYRLPTEAEWEKAARGGASGLRFPWGNSISESQANYESILYYSYDISNPGYNPAYATGDYPFSSPVGSFAPNGYGLNDMAGNIYEWCWDWYASPYGLPSNANPTGLDGQFSNLGRVLRGGGWGYDASYARCACRNGYYPRLAGSSYGLRCVRGH